MSEADSIIEEIIELIGKAIRLLKEGRIDEAYELLGELYDLTGTGGEYTWEAFEAWLEEEAGEYELEGMEMGEVYELFLERADIARLLHDIHMRLLNVLIAIERRDIEQAIRMLEQLLY